MGEAVGATVGEAVGVSSDGVLVGVAVRETVGEAGDGALVCETVGGSVGDAVGFERGRRGDRGRGRGRVMTARLLV